MQIINMTGRVRMTWDGKADIPPEGTVDTDTMSAAEVEWHLRHGFNEVKPKAKVVSAPDQEPVPEPATAPVEAKPIDPPPMRRKTKIHRRSVTRHED